MFSGEYNLSRVLPKSSQERFSARSAAVGSKYSHRTPDYGTSSLVIGFGYLCLSSNDLLLSMQSFACCCSTTKCRELRLESPALTRNLLFRTDHEGVHRAIICRLEYRSPNFRKGPGLLASISTSCRRLHLMAQCSA